MIDTFDLLMEYIIENACELWVYDKNEADKNDDGSSSIYKINRRLKANEGVCEATMKKGSTEYYLSVEEWEDDHTPCYIGICISSKDEILPHQVTTITKRDGKVTIE